MEENIYLYLNLTPKDSDATVKSTLTTQLQKWGNKATDSARAAQKVEILKRFKAELDANPNMLREHATKYAALIQEQRKEQEKAIRASAAIFVIDGEIEEARFNEIEKANKAFTRDEILAIIGAKIKQKKVFKYKETSSGKDLDSNIYKAIVKELEKVGKRDLYAFLNLPSTATAAEIERTSQKIYDTNQLAQISEERTAITALVAHCKSLLLDPSKRADYDYTLSNQGFANVRSVIERIGAGTEKVIRPEQYKKLIEECTRVGMSYDKAEYMIYKTAEANKVAVIEGSANSMAVCRFCGALNDHGAKLCKSCGMPIVVKCPQCGQESSKSDELRCTKCGFVIGDMPKAETLATDAETALKYSNVDEALRCYEAARAIWPQHPRLATIADSIRKIQSQVGDTIKEVKALCAKKQYYLAQTYLGKIGFGNEATLLRKEIESAIENADALIAKANGINDANARIDYYMQALSIAADCRAAKDKIALTPPTAPASITATVRGSAIHIEWARLQFQFIEYAVVRKVGGAPSSITDGEVISKGTRNNAYDDIQVEAGVSYFYAVYSKCGDVYSHQAATTSSPAMVVVDLEPEIITFDIHETQIGLGFKLPTTAKELEIYRDGKLVKTLTGSSYMDSGLKTDQSYTYKFVVVFEDCTGKAAKSQGITQVLTPTAPPKPVQLILADESNVAKLSWAKPAKGVLCIYESPKPFTILENNKVNVDTLKFKKVDITGTSYQLAKNFSGVKYFLPITIQGNVGVAGNQVRVVSLAKPSGVTFNRNEGCVVVNWAWTNVEAIRLQITVDNNNPQKIDIAPPAAATYKVNVPKTAKAVRISIAAKIEVEREVLLSEETVQTFSLQSVKVNFQDVESESVLGFIGKDKFSITIVSDSLLPCDLHLLVAENLPPMNIVNYKAYAVIAQNEVTPGTPLKKEFRFKRQMKGKPMHVRLIAANRALASQVVINPETRQIK